MNTVKTQILYERLLEKNPKVGSHNIQERYDAYNEIFYSKENI